MLKKTKIFLLFLSLFLIQANIRALAFTFTDHHNISIKKYNGETYLVLGHSRHSHFHDDQQNLKANHNHSHKDHFIKLQKLDVTINSITPHHEHIDSHHQTHFDSYDTAFKPLSLLSYSKPIQERDRCYSCSQSLLEHQYSIQFLV